MTSDRYLICYHLHEAIEQEIFDHPHEVVQNLGVTFDYATFDDTLEQWLFHNCEGTPTTLPSYLHLIPYAEN